MKIYKKITNIIYSVAIILLLFLAAGAIFSLMDMPSIPYRLFIVQSGSMEPSIKTGSVVVTASQEKYQQNDVITFKNNPKVDIRKAGSTTTHRIVEALDDEGRQNFVTKGDANESNDRQQVPISWIVGRVMFSIPYIGYAVALTHNQTGFILLIVIPATLIIYSEVMNIKKEIIVLIKKRKKKTDPKTKNSEKLQKNKEKDDEPKS